MYSIKEILFLIPNKNAEDKAREVLFRSNNLARESRNLNLESIVSITSFDAGSSSGAELSVRHVYKQAAPLEH